MKICRLCQESKPLDEFALYPRLSDGHDNRCKACLRAKARERYARDPEKLKARAIAAYWANPEDARKRARDYYKQNTEKVLRYSKEYNASHPRETWDEKKLVRTTLSQRKSHLRIAFGISVEEYDALVHKQDGKCAICGITPKGNLHVDHDHSTGKIRGLLCNPCNSGIGLLGDDIVIMQAAIRYLDKSTSQQGTKLRK